MTRLPNQYEKPQRRRPAPGVRPNANGPTLVFLTVCVRDRRPVLANPATHVALRHAWTEADSWKVSRYVIMPDHLHLFATPTTSAVSFENWISFWKRRFAVMTGRKGLWQAGGFHTRMRSAKQADAKWRYIEDNPVRANLAVTTDSWPFAGCLTSIEWNGT